MTPNQAAKYLRVSRMTVMRWIEKGKLQPTEPRNPLLSRPRIHLRRADVEAFAKAAGLTPTN